MKVKVGGIGRVEMVRIELARWWSGRIAPIFIGNMCEKIPGSPMFSPVTIFFFNK